MTRKCPEWIAKHDDQAIPPRVKLRILERENFICHLTGVKIDPVRDQFDFDHAIPLILGGRHAESNLFPALRDPHRKKTAAEMKVKAKIAAVRKKHTGVTRPAGKIQSPGFQTTDKAAKRAPKPPLLPRQLYQEIPT